MGVFTYMAELFKTAKAINAQQKNVDKLFDAAQTLVRTANSSTSAAPATLDKITQQVTDLQTKIQQQIAVLNTLQSDINTVPASLSQEPRDLVKSLLDDMHGRSRELSKIPAVISTIRAAQKQAAASPATTTKRANRKGETVSSGPPVTTSFNPEIAAAAAAESSLITDEPELFAAPEPEPIPAPKPARAPKTATPKPAAPPPQPAPPPPAVSKVTYMSREEAMASIPSKPPKAARPKKAKPAAKAAPAPTSVNTIEPEEEDDEVYAEGIGPYPPGFSRRGEASALRKLGEEYGPRVGTVTNRGGYESPEEEAALTSGMREYRRRAGLFRTTFGVNSYATRAGSLIKDLEGVQSTLGESAERNRFPELHSEYQRLVGADSVSQDEITAFLGNVHEARRGIAGQELPPQVQAALGRQLSGYEGAKRLANIAPTPLGQGAFGQQSATGFVVANQIQSRNMEIGRGDMTDSRREQLRAQVQEAQRLIQLEEQRLRLIHEEAEAAGLITQSMQKRYEASQREAGTMQTRLSQQERDLDLTKTRSTTHGQIEDMLEGRGPSLGSAFTNWRASRGTPLGTFGTAVARATEHPLGFGVGALRSGGTAVGRGIAGFVGAGEAATTLAGTAGAAAAVPIAGAIVGAIGMIVGQAGTAARHGSAVENIWRRGGGEGTTGFSTIQQGNTGRQDFTGGLYGDILGAGVGLGYSRDESVALAQQLASGGITKDNRLNGDRLKNAFNFSRVMGIDSNVTGQSLSELQRLDVGRGPTNQEHLLDVLASTISSGGMRGREQELVQSITSLTTTLASRGVGATEALNAPAGLMTIFNRSGNAALQGQYGANVLNQMDQGIQGASGVRQAFLFNSYNQSAGGKMDPYEFQYQQAMGVASPYALDSMKRMVTAMGGSQRGGVAIAQQFGLNPLVGRQLAQMVESGQLTQGNLQSTVENLRSGTVDRATEGKFGENLGTYEALGDATNKVTNELENWASTLAGPMRALSDGFSRIAGVLTGALSILGLNGSQMDPNAEIGGPGQAQPEDRHPGRQVSPGSFGGSLPDDRSDLRTSPSALVRGGRANAGPNGIVFPVPGAQGWTGGHWSHPGTADGANATDIEAPEGTPIFAPVGGTARLFSTGNNTAGGNSMMINDAQGREWYLAHMRDIPSIFGDNAKPGATATIEQGQQIGLVGHTGGAIDGHGNFTPTSVNHLHIGVGTNGITDMGAGNINVNDLLHPGYDVRGVQQADSGMATGRLANFSTNGRLSVLSPYLESMQRAADEAGVPIEAFMTTALAEGSLSNLNNPQGYGPENVHSDGANGMAVGLYQQGSGGGQWAHAGITSVAQIRGNVPVQNQIFGAESSGIWQSIQRQIASGNMSRSNAYGTFDLSDEVQRMAALGLETERPEQTQASRDRYTNAAQQVINSRQLRESYTNNPMSGLELAAANQMRDLNVTVSSQPIRLEWPDGMLAGTIRLNSDQDAVELVSRTPSSGFGGAVGDVT